MRFQSATTMGACAFAIFAVGASAQSAPVPQHRPALPPLAVPNARYTTLSLQVDVDRPAREVWARVGKYCDIAEWLDHTCVITSGSDGQLGAIRTLDSGGTELLVGRTDLSYTYTQPVRSGRPYNAYHATLEAKPVTATTSRLLISFFYDTSMLGDEAAIAAERTHRITHWTMALHNMKILAEGGTLPPPPRYATPLTSMETRQDDGRKTSPSLSVALRAPIAEQAEERLGLGARIVAPVTANEDADAEVARLTGIITAFQRHRFGARSEKLDDDQLELALEELDRCSA